MIVKNNRLEILTDLHVFSPPRIRISGFLYAVCLSVCLYVCKNGRAPRQRLNSWTDCIHILYLRFTRHSSVPDEYKHSSSKNFGPFK
jgi:hypothetical protein